MGIARCLGQTARIKKLVEVLQIALNLALSELKPFTGQGIEIIRGQVTRFIGVVLDAGGQRGHGGCGHRGDRLQGGLLSVTDRHMACGQLVQTVAAQVQAQVDAVDAGGPLTEVQVVTPTDVGAAKFRLGRQHVLPVQADWGFGAEPAVDENVNLGDLGRLRHMHPAGQGQQPAGKAVLVFMKVLEFFGSNVFAGRAHVLPAGMRAAHGLVECGQGTMAALKKALKCRFGGGAVVADPVGRGKAHAVFEAGKEVVHFAQQGDGLDVSPHRFRPCAKAFVQGANDVFAQRGDRVVQPGHAPRVERLAVIPIDGHGAIPCEREIVRVLGQGFFCGGAGAEVGGKQIQHQRLAGLFNGAHHFVEGLGVDLPAVGAWLDKVEQGHFEGVTP